MVADVKKKCKFGLEDSLSNYLTLEDLAGRKKDRFTMKQREIASDLQKKKIRNGNDKTKTCTLLGCK